MLFDIPSIANWKNIGDYRQRQTNYLRKRIQYKVGVKILVRKQVLSAEKSMWSYDPWRLSQILWMNNQG